MWKFSNADQLFQKLTLFPGKLKKIRGAFKLQSLKTQPAIPKLIIKLKGRGNNKKPNDSETQTTETDLHGCSKLKVSSHSQNCLSIALSTKQAHYFPNISFPSLLEGREEKKSADLLNSSSEVQAELNDSVLHWWKVSNACKWGPTTRENSP